MVVVDLLMAEVSMIQGLTLRCEVFRAVPRPGVQHNLPSTWAISVVGGALGSSER